MQSLQLRQVGNCRQNIGMPQSTDRCCSGRQRGVQLYISKVYISKGFLHCQAAACSGERAGWIAVAAESKACCQLGPCPVIWASQVELAYLAPCSKNSCEGRVAGDAICV